MRIMKICGLLILLFSVLLCSCDKEHYEENYFINNSFNNVNINDSTKTNTNNNTDNKKTGTISFGVSDVTEG